MATIFLSHSSTNNGAALALARWLEENGWDDYFLDISADRGIAAGERWQMALRQAANRCEAVLFLITPAWVQSPHCLAEFYHAKQLGKVIVGVLIEPMPLSSLPHEMTAESQLCDLVSGAERRRLHVALDGLVEPTVVEFSESGLRRLRAGLQRAGLAAEAFPWPPPDDPERLPYRGLRALDASDAAVFFGREAAIVRGLDTIRALARRGTEPLLVILGASGAGKSSFLRAGLWPRLARADREFLPLPVIRPERAVLTGSSGLVASLASAFRQAGDRRNRAELRQALLAPDGLARLVADLRDHARTRAGSDLAPTVILSIDQGEELFSADGRQEREAFLTSLGHAVRRQAPLLILLAIRSDAFEQLQQEAALSAIDRELCGLDPLPLAELKSVIEGPAARSTSAGRGLRVDPRLTERLVADTTGPDGLPLLAFTLERLLLEHGADGVLNLEDYESLGGVRGAITAAIEVAFAEPNRPPAIPSDAVERDRLLRRAFVPWLAAVDPTTGESRRRVAAEDTLPAETRALVDRLVEARLLVRDRRRVEVDGRESAVVEIAHEALLRQWTALTDWLSEESLALKTLEAVRRTAQDWIAHERRRTWLIHAGERLRDAEALLARAEFVALLGPDGRDYIQTCAAEERRQLGEQERVRQRELLDARRIQRISRILAGAAVLVLTVAGVAGVLFIDARQQERAARMASVVRTAQSLVERDPTAAALLLVTHPEDLEAEGLASLLTSLSSAPIATILRGHGAPVLSAAFSPDGTRIVTTGSDRTARVWRADGKGDPIVLRGHTDAVWTAAFSPDSKRVVTAGYLKDDTARIWAADGSGEPIVLDGHEQGVANAVFNPDGTRVVTLSGESTLRVWRADRADAPVVWPPPPPEPGGSPFLDIGPHFSRDGSRLLAGSDSRICVWAIGGAAQPAIWTAAQNGSQSRFVTAAFRSNDAVIALLDDGTVRTWELGGTPKVVVTLPLERGVTRAAFSPDLSSLATLADNTVQVWTAPWTEPRILRGQSGTAQSLDYAPDGKHVITTADDYAVRVWRRDASAAPIVLRGHAGHVRNATVNRQGTAIVTASLDETARIYSIEETANPLVLEGMGDGLHTAQFSADGHQLLTSSTSAAHLRDVESGAVLATYQGDDEIVAAGFRHGTAVIVTAATGAPLRLRGLGSHADAVAFSGPMPGPVRGALSRDGSRFAGTVDGAAFIWSTSEAGNAPSFFIRDDIGPNVFSPDGSLVVETEDKEVRLWRSDHAGQPIVLSGHTEEVLSAVFSEDGRHIITAGFDNTVRVWPANGNGDAVILRGRADPGSLAVLSPDAARLVTLASGSAWLWRLAAPDEPLLLRGHIDSVSAAAFHPDSTRIATASADDTVRLWRADDGGQAAILRGHPTDVASVVFSPDGNRLLSTDDDGTARLWNIDWQRLLEVLRSRVTSCLTSDERRNYLGETVSEAARQWQACEARFERRPAL